MDEEDGYRSAHTPAGTAGWIAGSIYFGLILLPFGFAEPMHVDCIGCGPPPNPLRQWAVLLVPVGMAAAFSFSARSIHRWLFRRQRAPGDEPPALAISTAIMLLVFLVSWLLLTLRA